MAKKSSKKKTVKSSPKAKKKTVAKKVPLSARRGVRGEARKPSRYNQLQKILGAYGREKKIKFGKGLFNKKVKELALRTQQVKTSKEGKRDITYTPLKFIEQNIDALYKEHLEPRTETKRTFPDSFSWYYYQERFNEFIFNGVLIRIYFMDDILSEPYQKQGYSEDVIAWFKNSGLYGHLRRNWNESPDIAQFVLEDTDGSTFANYVSIMGAAATLEEMEKEHIEEKTPADAEEQKKQQQIAELKLKLKTLSDKLKAGIQAKKEAEKKAGISEKEKEASKAEEKKFEKEIEFEKEKQKTEIEKQKTKAADIELINKRLQLIETLRGLGMSNEQIIDQLNKLS